MRLGHESSAPLLAVNDELDVITVKVKAIEYGQVTFPWHPKSVCHALCYQALDQ
jgi:hypothetical protein